jgi:hypothetical protein
MGERGFKIRKILIIFLIVVTAIAIFFNLVSDYRTKDKNSEIKESAPLNESASEKEFCYYRSSASVPDYFDVAWLKIKENDNLVSGEFRNLPTETDSKIGLFEGKIVGFDEENKIKKTEVIWDTFAEGMFAKEELIIDYNDYYVITYFGELYNRGDDVYVFKDKNNLYPQKKMEYLDCSELEEKLLIEEYVRENIKNLSETKEVLGGSWYATKIEIDNTNNSGKVWYEDGHIAQKAKFNYNYNSETRVIEITSFEQL